MIRLSRVCAAVLSILTCLTPAAARQDFDAEIPGATDVELVVVEAGNCAYCYIFRRDVLPSYQSSERGKQVPVLFVDVNDTATAHLKLLTSIDVVPTFIVTKNRVEIGRLQGYSGPENFYHAINYLLTKP